VIIIECNYITALERLGFIQKSGFQLFDIVDLVYYGAGIFQFDLIFVRPNLITPEIRPPFTDFKDFKSDLWCLLSL
jgi:hypothetical protein